MLPSGCIRSGLRTRDEKPDRSTGTALTRTSAKLRLLGLYHRVRRRRYGGIGRVVPLDRYDEAIPWFQRSSAANPSNGVGASLRSDILAARTAALALGDHTGGGSRRRRRSYSGSGRRLPRAHITRPSLTSPALLSHRSPYARWIAASRHTRSRRRGRRFQCAIG